MNTEPADRNDASLVDEFFRVLSRYQCLDAFFGPALQVRRKSMDFLDNRLVQILLSESDCSRIEIPASVVRSQAPATFEGLRMRLTPKESDFNEKTLDAWSEILTARELIRIGYSNLHAIPSSTFDPPNPTPDFDAVKAGRKSYVETKHMRSPYSEEVFLESRLGRFKIKHPEIGKKTYIYLDVLASSLPDRLTGVHTEKLDRLCSEIEGSLRRDHQGVRTWSVKFSDSTMLRVKLEWEPRRVGVSIRHSYKSTWSGKDKKAFIIERLDPIYQKARRIIFEGPATKQLLAPADSAACEKMLVLHWDRPEHCIPYPELVERFESWVCEQEKELRRQRDSDLWVIRALT